MRLWTLHGIDVGDLCVKGSYGMDGYVDRDN